MDRLRVVICEDGTIWELLKGDDPFDYVWRSLGYFCALTNEDSCEADGYCSNFDNARNYAPFVFTDEQD